MSDTVIDAPRRGWTARWIWNDASRPDQWMRFRRRLDLGTAARRAVARIACDSKYWLWIDGHPVVREGALKRGPTARDTWFDEIDLAPHLRAGANQIAILVWYWGVDGFSHNDSGHGGLLCEVEIDGAVVDGTATGGWRVSPHPAYEPTADGPSPNYRLSERNVRFDARRDDPGWCEASYDDAAWPHASELARGGEGPWGELWPRPVAAWRWSEPLAYVDAASIPAIAPGGEVVCRLPSNLHVVPIVELTAAAGATVVMKTDHYAGGGNGQHFVVRAEYVTRDGRQAFEAPNWVNGHAVHYDLPAGATIHRLGYRETGYDCDLSGAFACDDPFYATLWAKAQRTLYVTMRDTYFDCPDRERAQWWGDVVIEIGESFYGLSRHADALSRKAILDLCRWQRSDGVLFSPVPAGNWFMELPPQMLAAISTYGFWTYFWHSGDDSWMAEAYPHVRRYLEKWSLDERDLVVHRSGEWDWGDWGEHVDLGMIDATWYVLALDAAARYARHLGRIDDIAGYDTLRARVLAAIRRHCWTADGWRSPSHQGEIDDRAAAMAVLCGASAPEHRAATLAVLARVRHASPYMEKYVLEALFALDADDLAFQRMRERYAPMVEAPVATLWEFWTRGGWGTENHAWAGGPLTLLSQIAVGIDPLEPGYRRFRVRPRPGPLTTLSATVPSARGIIRAAFTRRAGGGTLTLEVPTGSQAVIDLSAACPGATVRAPSGAARGADGLVVGPGTWTVEAG
ncbi:MAG TPA: alpha-L-rhamnosidase C-terminal domain-containing protein [Planctomycetota bacterium]|nr:alpha-L-rhamnosidase C-terminal domain-containing protein [Planctomycetota bacterium]